MPRKRKNIHSLKKEAKIRTRLIQLSMKVEDFIYQKDPISKTEAEKFLREVCSYKTECHKDARSLQVIEKLTRCMKAIITEHQERRLNGCRTNDDYHYPYDDDVRANSVSPVYSLPDDDRTQFTQEDIPVTEAVNNILPNALDNDYVNTQFTQVIHKVPESNNTVIDVINLCDGEDNESVVAANETSHIDVDMHKALSNLSIKDIANDEPMVDGECSQSILNNFEEINTIPFKTAAICSSMPDNNVKPEVQNQAPIILKDAIKILKPTIVKSNNINTTFNERDINNPLILKVSKAITNTFNIDKPVNSNNIITSSKILDKGNVNTSTTNTFNYIQQNTPIINNMDKINAILIHKTDNSTKVLPTTNNVNQTKENKNEDIINIKNKSAVIKKKRGPRKKKEIQSKVNISEMEKIDLVAKNINKNQTTKIQKKTYARTKINDNSKDYLMSIYNKNVENDLSWLEGIRFVREIGDDEYEKHQDLSEDFWSNYYLPPNFDDNDFLT